MPAVVIPPGLDGAPSEVMRAAVLVGEGHLRDSVVAVDESIAGGMFKGSEDAHFEVV